MRQLVKGERAAVSELAAINHRWEIEIAIEAPVYIVDFCCLGLDENGEVIDDEFIINFNRPDAPRGAIQLNNASNNGAVFSLALEQLPPRVRRLVFTASIGENPLPGGLIGAAFSLLGVSAELGRGHIILATPAAEMAFFEFSGQDFGQERTLVVGEFYLRDEWRFVAAGQPLQGELGTFLRTLTDGPTPAPLPIPQNFAPPLSVPARVPRPIPTPPTRSAPQPVASVLAPPRAPMAPLTPTGTRTAPIRTAPPTLAPPRVIPVPARQPGTPLAPAAATIVLPPISAAIEIPAPAVSPVSPPSAVAVAPLNLPQSVPAGGTLQDLIDAAAPGSTLILQRGEYPGPLRIAKPLTLEGQGSAIWKKEGPVVTVASPGVWLHDLDLEITVASEDAGERGVALQIERIEGPLELEGVFLKGRIAGLGASDGTWQMPRALDLGEFAARADNEFHFPIQVAVPATLGCAVGGVEVSPSRVEAGAHQISLRVRDLAPDTLLVGQIEVAAAGLIFYISLQGSAQNGLDAARGQEIGAN